MTDGDVSSLKEVMVEYWKALYQHWRAQTNKGIADIGLNIRQPGRDSNSDLQTKL